MVTKSKSAPLVPPGVDLRDFPFTPIFRARLFGSSFHARTNDAEWRAGVTLWLRSWDQVPAGSLPDDETDLCRIAELGRDLKAWRRVKDGALHGWIKCSDGRLYHRVVAEKCLECWLEKLTQRISGGVGNAKRWNVPFDRALLDAAMSEAKSLLAALNPQSRSLSKRAPIATPASPSDRIPITSRSHPDRDGIASEVKGSDSKSLRALSGEVPDDEFEVAWKALPKRFGNNPKADALKAWKARLREGVKPTTMIEGAERYRALCEATAKVSTEFVMQGVRFFGAARPFEQDFTLPTASINGKPWFLSAKEIDAKGVELGKTPPPQTDPIAWNAYRDDVRAAHGITVEMVNAAKKDFAT